MLAKFLNKRGAPPPAPGAPPTGENPADAQFDPWGMLSQQGQQPKGEEEESQATPFKPEKHTVEPEIAGGPYHMVGSTGYQDRNPAMDDVHGESGYSGRMTPEEAGYMELKGAKKDGDCKKVAVPGGVSLQLGCCNEFEAEDKEATQRFSCGTCEYKKAAKSQNTETLVGEGHMANEKKSSREALREKLAALAESKKASQFGRLREVAKVAPAKVGEALGELARSASILSSSLATLKENLDLNEAPRAASLKARVAARKKYAVEFRRIAEANPEQLADSVIELYRSIDEIVTGLENFAANMGIELPGPEEEGLPGDILSGDGDEGLHGEMPIGGGEDIAPNPLEAKGERLETPAEEQTEIEEGTEGTEEDQQQDEELAKEAADAGSAGFVTDRDSESKPKTPEKAEVPRLAAKSKGATGAGGFVTNRDQSAEPKPVEKAEIPVSQGEAAITAALRDKAGW